jgi:hypothetical protein
VGSAYLGLGITQARGRRGSEPLRELFSQLAVPVADDLTRWAYLGPWWLMAIDGFGPPWTQLPSAVRAPSRLLTFARTFFRATEGGHV